MKPSELIAKPENWTKGANARDNELGGCNFSSPYAESWCMIGAVALCVSEPIEYPAAMLAIRKRIKEEDVARWNDAPERTHAEVIAVLKECGL